MKKDEDYAVKHPDHYNEHPSGVECITIAQHFTFNVGSVIKYLWRAGLKTTEGTADEMRLQDHKKAREYLNFEIRRLEELAEKQQFSEKAQSPATGAVVEQALKNRTCSACEGANCSHQWHLGIKCCPDCDCEVRSYSNEEFRADDVRFFYAWSGEDWPIHSRRLSDTQLPFYILVFKLAVGQGVKDRALCYHKDAPGWLVRQAFTMSVNDSFCYTFACRCLRVTRSSSPMGECSAPTCAIHPPSCSWFLSSRGGMRNG